jgi:transketolase
MRASFAKLLLEIAESDPRVVLLTGDLGFTVWESFAERLPDQYINVGVAEQNMVGIATGLAEAGFIPFTYSIATFMSMRPYEFIRNGPVQHRLPVRIVGVGGGFDYGHNGVSHYALEDIALMRAQPGLTVIAPTDPEQTRAAVKATWQQPGPIYYRLGKQAEAISELPPEFELGRAQIVGDGDDVALIALGAVAGEALQARRALSERGVNVTVVIVSCVQPAPEHDLLEVLARVPLAVTAEDHYLIGGLGSLVAETIAEGGLACRLVRCGARRMPRGDTGSRGYLHDRHGLSAGKLADAVVSALSLARS